jgi:hypothetical protein
LLRTDDCFYFDQQIPEFAVIDLYAIIEVEADPLIGVVS